VATDSSETPRGIFSVPGLYTSKCISVKERIFLHIVLNPALNMNSFDSLFYDAVSVSV
jgi:hypothetical protein